MISLLVTLGLVQLRPDLPSWSAFPGDAAVSVGSEHVHDPTVVNTRGTWLTFSTSGDGMPVVRSSRDLRTWKIHGSVAMPRPGWLEGRYRHRSIWAPDILILPDRIRLYYCQSDFGTNRSVIGLAENVAFDPARPTEGWIDRGLVFETKPKEPPNAIDPETFVDAEGRHWMIFGSYFGGIYEFELDPKTGLRIDASEPRLVARNPADPANALEGAAVARRNGFYYLFVSYGLAAQGVRSTYRVMVGRAKSPNGPFVDASGTAMTEGGHVEMLKGSPPMFSPGHTDVLQAPDGRWLMPYHFYDARSYWGNGNWGLPRLQIRELLWTADGWPLPGLPVEFPHPAAIAKTLSPGRWILQRDFGEPTSVRIESGGQVVQGERRGTLVAVGSDLRLTIGTDAPLLLTPAYAGTYAVGRDADGHIVRLVRTAK